MPNNDKLKAGNAERLADQPLDNGCNYRGWWKLNKGSAADLEMLVSPFGKNGTMDTESPDEAAEKSSKR